MLLKIKKYHKKPCQAKALVAENSQGKVQEHLNAKKDSKKHYQSMIIGMIERMKRRDTKAVYFVLDNVPDDT